MSSENDANPPASTSSSSSFSTPWHKIILICLVGWMITILGANVLPDGVWNILFFGSWSGLPIAISQDARALSDDIEWPQYTWVYLITSAIWFVSLVAGGAYLIQRRRKTSLQSGNDISEAENKEGSNNIASPDGQSKVNSQNKSSLTKKERSSADINAIREKAEKTVISALDAKKSGDIESAVSLLNEAIEQYEHVIKKANSVDKTTVSKEAEETVQLVKDRRETLKSTSQKQSELVEDLERGERYLQTAIVAHLHGENTVANLRYRQARERYESAFQTVEEVKHLAGSVEVNIRSEKQLKPDEISENIEDTSQLKLLIKDIEDVDQVSDLLQVDYRSDTGKNIINLIDETNLNDNKYIDSMNKAEILVNYSDQENILFNTEDEIRMRYEHANRGYQMTNTDME